MKTLNQDAALLERRNKALAAVLFLLSPLLAVFAAFKNYHAKWPKNILWGFIVFYGATMVISREGMDAAVYRDTLIYMHSLNMDFGQLWITLYNPLYGELDIVNPIIVFVVSSFTSNYHVLFAVYGFVFGFFYSRNIWYLFEHADGDIKKRSMIYILVFALIVGFWNINGFRFWTAALVFFYGAMPYVFEKKMSKLWIAAASILFHFSFFVPVILLFGFIVLKNKVHIFFYFFLITFFVNSINLESLGSFLETIFPEMLYDKTKGYTNPEYAETVAVGKQQMSLYARVFRDLMGYVIAAFLFYIYAKRLKDIKQDSGLYRLFNFSLFFLGFANLFSLMPSGGRFSIVGNLFAVALILFYLQRFTIDKGTRYLTYLVIPFIALFIVVTLRIGTDTVGVGTIVGNPITMFFIDNDWALIELIKK